MKTATRLSLLNICRTAFDHHHTHRASGFRRCVEKKPRNTIDAAELFSLLSSCMRCVPLHCISGFVFVTASTVLGSWIWNAGLLDCVVGQTRSWRRERAWGLGLDADVGRCHSINCHLELLQRFFSVNERISIIISISQILAEQIGPLPASRWQSNPLLGGPIMQSNLSLGHPCMRLV